MKFVFQIRDILCTDLDADADPRVRLFDVRIRLRLRILLFSSVTFKAPTKKVFVLILFEGTVQLHHS
jgi:hypothetical protein